MGNRGVLLLGYQEQAGDGAVKQFSTKYISLHYSINSSTISSIAIISYTLSLYSLELEIGHEKMTSLACSFIPTTSPANPALHRTNF